MSGVHEDGLPGRLALQIAKLCAVGVRSPKWAQFAQGQSH